MNFLKSFKEKKCTNIFCKFFQSLLFNTITQILFGASLVIITSIILNFTTEGTTIDNIVGTIFNLGALILSIIALVFIGYAWIVKPIITLVAFIVNKMNKK